jgi:hypothetical protein
MASPAQVIANRANALQSTGPRTEEGKRSCAANAVTSGLTAVQLFIRPDELPTFTQLKSDLLAELKPLGTTQNLLFDRILHAAWNLRRCDQLELKIQEEAFAKNLDDALLDDELTRKLDRIYRYKKMHESSHRRAMADLRQLQTEAVWRRESRELPEESILVNTAQVATRLGHLSAVDQRASLAPPPLSPSQRHRIAA